jgi:hypothetical protein
MATATGQPMNKLALLFLLVSPPVLAEIWSCTTKDMVTNYEYRFTLKPGAVVTTIQGQQVPQPRVRTLTRALPSEHDRYAHVMESLETKFNTSVWEQLQWSGTGAVQYARIGHRGRDVFHFVGQGQCLRIE